MATVKFNPHKGSLILPLLSVAIAAGLCALLFHVADAFEHSFLKLAGHDIRRRTETVAEEVASYLKSGDLASALTTMLPSPSPVPYFLRV